MMVVPNITSAFVPQILIPASIGEVLFVAGKLGYTDTAFTGTLIAIFGSPVLTLLISKYGKGKSK